MISERFKQRLVGVLVLLALTAIFLPVLFDLQPSIPLDETSRIPPAPDVEPVHIEEPVSPPVEGDVMAHDDAFDLAGDTASGEMPVQETAQETASSPPPAATVASETAAAKTPPPLKPGLAANGLPEAWVIQVASYRESAAAEKLSTRLLAAGHKAFVRPAVFGSAKVYRVYVGPHVLRKSAEDEKVRIDSAEHVKSLILPFEP